MNTYYIIQCVSKAGIFYISFDKDSQPSFIQSKSNAARYTSQVLARGWLSYAKFKYPANLYSLISYEDI